MVVRINDKAPGPDKTRAQAEITEGGDYQKKRLNQMKGGDEKGSFVSCKKKWLVGIEYFNRNV